MKRASGKRRNLRHAHVLFAAAAATLFSARAMGQSTDYWVGGDGNWSDPSNWNPAAVPGAYTLAGDANLDGKVDFTDLGIVGQHLNTSGNDWAHGNFTYDPNGAVTFTDLGIVGQNLNKLLPAKGESEFVPDGGTLPLARSTSIQNSVAILPEPRVLALVAGAGLLARRQRHRRRGNVGVL